MTTQTFGIQGEIADLLYARKILAAKKREEEAQRRRLVQEALIAALRNDIGAVLDSLDGAEIIYNAELQDDCAKAMITIGMDDTLYRCFVTHTKGSIRIGIHRYRDGIDHYVGLADLRDEILMTLIQQIEYDREIRKAQPADLPF